MLYMNGVMLQRIRTGETFVVTATPDSFCIEDTSVPAYELSDANGARIVLSQTVVESKDYVRVSDKQPVNTPVVWLVKVRDSKVPSPNKLPIGHVFPAVSKEHALKLTASGLWRLANGAAVPRREYPELFEVLGYRYSNRVLNLYVPKYHWLICKVMEWFGRPTTKVITVTNPDFNGAFFNLPDLTTKVQ